VVEGELSVIQARQLHAPRQPGGLLAEPPLDAVGALLARNRDRLAFASLDLLGRSYSDLRKTARQALRTAASTYLAAAGEPIPELPQTDSLLVAGHQPELFHPGVWLKHFALNGLARRHGCVPINLVVDNDTLKSAALKVPGWEGEHSSDRVRRFTVPFDHWTSELPYEDRPVLDEATFAGLPERVRQITRDWAFKPMLDDFWPEVLRQGKRTRLVGERFAAARRAFERRWGCHNLEVPLHEVCKGEGFAWFALHLFHNLPKFHRIYNDRLAAYRTHYGIRSRAHPVPDLAAEGDWLEAPFWAWRPDRPVRGRLMVRPAGSSFELRVGGERWPDVPKDPEEAVQRWQEFDRLGYRLRSRALTTTLFARLFLSDLFIHGIGGAKYDELTDDIARHFYGSEPPEYLVLSATLLLPLPAYSSHPEDCRRLANQLRDVHWNPQRHLSKNGSREPAAEKLAGEKLHWIATEPQTSPERRQRYRQLFDITQRMQPYVAEPQQALEARWKQCVSEVEANAILSRRDYAFCLFPEAMLAEFFQPFLKL
jgi:hypothetical protein